jgi:hypothetical protein
MTYAFRNQMLRQGAFLFVGLVAVLLILVGSVSHKVFLVTALVLIPAAAITFNLVQRRAYAAYQQGHKR